MTHYIHAPHKRNFAERPKRNTPEWRLWFHNYCRGSLRRLGIKGAEPVESAQSKWINREEIFQYLSGVYNIEG